MAVTMRCRSIVVIAGCAALLMAGSTARAQSFGTARILRPRQQESGERARPNYFSIAPVLFLGIDNRNERTASAGALVIGYERGIDVRSRDSAAQVGAFIYTQGDNALFQFQGKYYFNPHVGLQASLLEGDHGGKPDTALFALYNLSTRTLDPKARIPWDFQVGLGSYFPGKKTESSPNSLSGFVQLGFNVTPTVSINSSYWGIATKDDSSINRFLVGVGYSF